jgi:predicted aldo/keto reductase-like oxidoreductase
VQGFVTELIANAKNCVGCGECEMKCPYTLPIREMIQENLVYYRQFLENRK